MICLTPEIKVDFNLVNEDGEDGGNSGLLIYKGGTVCDDYFDQNAADAICSLMGFSRSGSEWNTRLSQTESYYYLLLSNPNIFTFSLDYEITLDNVRCSHAYWTTCEFSESHNCDHSEDVFLTCREVEGRVCIEFMNRTSVL